MNRHNMAFFGQKTAFIFDSTESTSKFSFITFIKKNGDVWEKKEQGKTIKLNLLELWALNNCISRLTDWSTVHTKGEEKTQISFNYQEDKNMFWFGVNDYKKPLSESEFGLFGMLLSHILYEKIENATGGGGKDIDQET